MNSKKYYSNKNDGNIFKELRKNKGVSQSVIARELNVTQSAISKWESGVAVPDPDTLKKLADYYNVSTDMLLGVKNVQKKEPIDTSIDPRLYNALMDLNFPIENLSKLDADNIALVYNLIEKLSKK